MKAAVIYENGGPDVLRYEDVPDPECPGGHVVVDVEAISIEGGDLLHRAGAELPSVPHIVGYLAAGRISDVGAGVEDRAVGDRVVALNAAGSHASKRAVPAMSTWPIPDGLDAARAACIPVAYGTAQECLFTAGNLPAGRPDPRRRGWRRDGRDPAGQAGRRDRDRDRVQRREARTLEGVRARPRDQLRHGCRGHASVSLLIIQLGSFLAASRRKEPANLPLPMGARMEVRSGGDSCLRGSVSIRISGNKKGDVTRAAANQRAGSPQFRRLLLSLDPPPAVVVPSGGGRRMTS